MHAYENYIKTFSVEIGRYLLSKENYENIPTVLELEKVEKRRYAEKLS